MYNVNAEQETQMAKKTVKFDGDAPKPRPTNFGTLGLRSPFPLTIPALQEIEVDLGFICDRWLSLLPHKTIFPQMGSIIIEPGKPAKVKVKNFSDAPALIEVGDVLLECVVLDSGDFKVV
jgi:hypothetical protein